ncbi:sporulation protein YqfD [Gorillibacterium sp. sgz5001074]|uniref:sporulation protein YqfD n=1 Tax=Gorillibacterium sp. sgz5001074 TaxID=3446695 RepID=UPI003F679CDB
MQPHFVRSIRGYVTVTVRGKELESFLNRAVTQGYTLWDIRRTGLKEARTNILIRDFFRLRALLKETGCRVHVEKRRGFPFFLGKLEKRKFFVAGLVGFFAGIYLLSSVIWQVRVEGNETIATHEILQAAATQGIKPYQWKFRLKPMEELARGLHGQLPSVSWVGVERQGTRITIRIVESARPEQRELLNPRHLVASKSAVVTQVTSTKGKPVVEPNRYVRKGDVLISGIIGDETNNQIVPAEGKVKGIVWYESKLEIPLTQQFKTYTGESYSKQYVVFGGRALQLTGYGQEGYGTSESESDRKTLGWRQYVLPVGWLKETIRETKEESVPLDESAARSAGIERAKADILMKAGQEARFVSYHVLQDKVENGKISMQVLFQVEENISEELAIVPGQ